MAINETKLKTLVYFYAAEEYQNINKKLPVNFVALTLKQFDWLKILFTEK